MKLKIFKRVRKPAPDPTKYYRLHRAEFGHDIKKKTILSYSYYPDTNKVIEFISQYLKMPKENLIIGLGAESIIKDFFLYLNAIKKKKIFFLTPTFGMYSYYSKLFNFKIYNDELYPGNNYSLEKIKKNLIKNKIDCLILVNPSHPIENFYNQYEIKNLVKFCKSKKINLVIDEVYSFEKSVDMNLIKNDNLLFIRSFSKSFGLPGIRVGFAIGSTKMIEKLENFRLAIEMGSDAVEFIKKQKKLEKKISLNQKKIKKAVIFANSNFKKRGIKSYNFRGNSVTFDCESSKEALKIFNYLLKNKIFVLKFNAKKLLKFLNITCTSIINLKYFFKTLDAYYK